MSTNATQIHVLLVADAKEARRLRALLESSGSTPLLISHISDSDLAAEKLSSIEADVLLLDMGSKQRQGCEFVEEVRAAAPDMPMVILSESEDEDLAVQALQQGVQDILTKV